MCATRRAAAEWLSVTCWPTAAGGTDAILLRHAHRAGTPDALSRRGSALAAAVQPGAERRAETLAQGTAFALAARVWGAPLLLALPEAAYPVAVGALAAAHGVAEDDAAARSCCTPLPPTWCPPPCAWCRSGKRQGLRILAGARAASWPRSRPRRRPPPRSTTVGGACFRSDIAAMRHETQYTRLFRT